MRRKSEIGRAVIVVVASLCLKPSSLSCGSGQIPVFGPRIWTRGPKSALHQLGPDSLRDSILIPIKILGINATHRAPRWASRPQPGFCHEQMDCEPRSDTLLIRTPRWA